MKIDIDAAKAEHESALDKLIETHGGATFVPRDEWHLVAEKLRASYAIHINPDTPVSQVLTTYAVDHRVWSSFVDAAVIEKKEKRVSRADKVSAALAWAADNVGKEVTIDIIRQECEIAGSMAKKLTEDRPDIFRKVKRGHFEIRDPKADREADKTEGAPAEESEESAEEEN